jgi:hypothetical protein
MNKERLHVEIALEYANRRDKAFFIIISVLLLIMSGVLGIIFPLSNWQSFLAIITQMSIVSIGLFGIYIIFYYNWSMIRRKSIIEATDSFYSSSSISCDPEYLQRMAEFQHQQNEYSRIKHKMDSNPSKFDYNFVDLFNRWGKNLEADYYLLDKAVKINIFIEKYKKTMSQSDREETIQRNHLSQPLFGVVFVAFISLIMNIIALGLNNAYPEYQMQLITGILIFLFSIFTISIIGIGLFILDFARKMPIGVEFIEEIKKIGKEMEKDYQRNNDESDRIMCKLEELSK